jgi:hypothetical protein
MKMLLRAKMPNEPFNSLIKSGKAGEKIQAALADMKPEAIYFTEIDGSRGCIAIVDVDKPSSIPAIAEPLFLLFNAEVSFHIVMTPQDLAQANLDTIGKKFA